MRAMFFGMAFQETTHMTAAQRDDGKDDNKDGSTNWSLWNLSEDLLRTLGYQGSDFSVLNKTEELHRVIQSVHLKMKRPIIVYEDSCLLSFPRLPFDARFFMPCI